MLEDLAEVPWGSLAQPDWNAANDEVPFALRALAAAASEHEARETYHQVLFALGNNHAGTYYPVALAAVPFLGQILETDPEAM